MEISYYWRQITDNLNDALLILNTDGEITFANSQLCQQTGYKREELTGATCLLLQCTGCQTRENCTSIKSYWCHLFAHEKTISKNCTLRHKDGKQLHYSKVATVLKNEAGTVMGAIEIFTDISTHLHQRQEIESLKRISQHQKSFHGMIGNSDSMQMLYSTIQNVSCSEASILIVGESGTGKELIAKALHELSARANMPYFKINCANADEALLEKELLHSLEAAHGGTIFLDEIGDISTSTQLLLLELLENKTIIRAHDTKSISIDVRIISSTHSDLEEKMLRGSFREDLYYRIAVFPLHCPRLEEREDDVLLIANDFIQINNKRYDKKIQGLDRAVLKRYLAHSWPGNIRELRNSIEYAFITCKEAYISLKDLPPRLQHHIKPERAPHKILSKRELLISALQQSNGNQSKAAKALGISRVTVWKQIKKYHIEL